MRGALRGVTRSTDRRRVSCGSATTSGRFHVSRKCLAIPSMSSRCCQRRSFADTVRIFASARCRSSYLLREPFEISTTT